MPTSVVRDTTIMAADRQRRKAQQQDFPLLDVVDQLPVFPLPVRVFLYIGWLNSWDRSETRNVYLSLESDVLLVLDTLRSFYLLARELRNYPSCLPTIDHLHHRPPNAAVASYLSSLLDLLRYHCVPSAVQLDQRHLVQPDHLASLFADNLEAFNHPRHKRLMCDFEDTAVLRRLDRVARRHERRIILVQNLRNYPDQSIVVSPTADTSARPTRQRFYTASNTVQSYVTRFPTMLRYEQQGLKVHADRHVNVDTSETFADIRAFARFDDTQ